MPEGLNRSIKIACCQIAPSRVMCLSIAACVRIPGANALSSRMLWRVEFFPYPISSIKIWLNLREAKNLLNFRKISYLIRTDWAFIPNITP
jgi:hypothetical protein